MENLLQEMHIFLALSTPLCWFHTQFFVICLSFGHRQQKVQVPGQESQMKCVVWEVAFYATISLLKQTNKQTSEQKRTLFLYSQECG